MNVITRGIRNAFRNSIRTASIVVILGLSIGLALAMLVARQAVEDKIQSVKSSIGNTVSISPAGVRGFEGGGEALTGKVLDELTDISHVTSVNKTLNDRLDSDTSDLESSINAGSLGQRNSGNNGQRFQMRFVEPGGASMGASEPTVSFTPPVTVIGTTTPNDLSNTVGGGSFNLKDGKVFAGNSTDNVALIGTSLAEKNSLTVGDSFTAYSQQVTVVGIFDGGNTFTNSQVIMPLATLQTLSGQLDSITSATVAVDSITNVEAATAAIQSKLGDDADVTNNAEAAEASLAPLENIKTVSTYSLFGAIAAGSVIILLTMIMIVRERRREIGVLKAIGASNVKVVSQFMAEAVTLTSLGAVVGIVIGVIASNPLTQMLIDGSGSSEDNSPVMGEGPRVAQSVSRFGSDITNVTASVGWDIILYGLGAAIFIGIIGSLVASYFIAKIRPAEVMRTE